MSADIMTAPLPRRSRWIPWLFLGGFGVVVAANAIMIFFAIGSFTGLTTSEPYTKGLRFNDQIRQAQAQERLGWRLAARFQRTGALGGDVEIKLADRDGAPLTGARVTATFARPVEKDRDFVVELQSAGGGRYVGHAKFALPGAWDVRYRVESDGQALIAADRLQVE